MLRFWQPILLAQTVFETTGKVSRDLKITINFAGPKLPQACAGGSMTTLPNGNEAVLIGCNDGNKNGLEKIFKIFWQGDGLRWGTLDQELKYPRNHAVAMIIPDSLTECTRKSKVQTSLNDTNSCIVEYDV